MLSAISIALRCALIAFPNVKPVLAITIISGCVFGPMVGTCAGAITMLVSNALFGQGVWTIWQMISAGLIGFIFGFARIKNRFILAIFGSISVFVIYGLIMDIQSAFMFYKNVTISKVFATLIAGVQFNVIHALATAAFLLILGGRIREILEKYKGEYDL